MAPESLASYKLSMSWHLSIKWAVGESGINEMSTYSTVNELAFDELAVDEMAVDESPLHRI